MPVNGSSDDPPDAAVAAGLVARIMKGDQQAETELFERYARGLRLILRRAASDPETAADLHQETFRIVIERLRGVSLNQPEKLSAFIHGVARNLVKANNRKEVTHRTQTDTELVEAAPSQLTHPLAELERDENANLVREMIDELPVARDREILLRCYVLDQDRAVICAALGLDQLHFNRVLFRAKERFKALLEQRRRRQRLRVVGQSDDSDQEPEM